MGPIIDLTTLFPWRIISIFSQTFTSYNICHNCLKDKRNPLFTFSLVFLVRLLSSFLFYNNADLNAFGYLAYAILYFLVLLITTDGSIFLKVLCPIFQLLSTIISAFVIGFLVFTINRGEVYSKIDSSKYQYLYPYLTQCIIIIITGYIFNCLLRLINSKKTKTQEHNKILFAYLTFFPVSNVLVIVLALIIPTNFENTSDFAFTEGIIILFFMGSILIFDCFYPFIVDVFEKLSDENKQQEKLLIKNKLEYEQTKMLVKEKEEFKKLKHDFLNLLTTTKGFIEIGNFEKALEIINSTQKNIQKISGVPICSNETVNTVLFVKQQQAEKLDIKFEININETSLLKVDNYSICRIMHNMIDNAINATSQADNKIIKIHIDINELYFIMVIQNFYIKEKKNIISREHGNGINIINEVAKKYKGDYSYMTDNNLYISKIELHNDKIKH